MRKITAVALVTLAMSGISLGQEADTSNVATEIQQMQETAPMVINTPEKITLPKWIIGFTANNLEFKSWPGTVTAQKRIGEKNFLSLGISGSYQQYGPDENDNTYMDTVISINKGESQNWGISLTPEINRVIKNNNSWLLSTGIEGLFSFNKSSGSSETISKRYPYYYNSTNTVYKKYIYGINIPASLEKRIKIRGQILSIGLRSYIVQASSSVDINDYQNVNSSDLYYYSNTSHSKNTMPWQVTLKNPFQGNVQVQIKYWF